MPHEAPAAPSAHASAPPPVSRGALRSIGPAMIIACVVLGPGSILLASRVGAEHGYSMGWLLALAGVLMGGMVALGARLGVVLTNTPCQEIAVRLGRPAAAALGILLFLIIASFQSSNNIAVLAATEALMPRPLGTGESLAVLVALNGLIVAVLLGFRRLYKPSG
jgi:manganese transport protein